MLKYPYVIGHTESIKNLQYANEKAKHCFFSSDFYKRYIYRRVYKYNYFVTSERCNPSPVDYKRLFTIRQSLPSGEVITVGKFQAYKNRNEAEKEIKRLIDLADQGDL